MQSAKLKIDVDEIGRGSVLLDGMDIGHCVTAIEFKAQGGCELTQVRLTIVAQVDAEVTAKFEQIALSKKEAPPPEGARLMDGRVLTPRSRSN